MIDTMHVPRVYLAGRMTGLSDRGTAWREDATRLLSPLVAEDPTKLELPSHDPKDIVAVDIAAIRRSAALLVYIGVPSWGTAMEIWYAKHANIPVISWTGPEFKEKLSPWVRYASTEIHETMAEAVNSIRERHLGHL